MAKFRDGRGRVWEIGFTLGNLPAVREAGFNVSQAVRDPKAGFDPLDDPETVGRVMWVLCAGQAEKIGVTPEEFAAGFDGPAIAAAVDAVMEALADFSQRPAVAAAVKERLPGARERLEKAVIERVSRAMEEMTPSGSNATGGNSPAVSGPTPAG